MFPKEIQHHAYLLNLHNSKLFAIVLNTLLVTSGICNSYARYSGYKGLCSGIKHQRWDFLSAKRIQGVQLDMLSFAIIFFEKLSPGTKFKIQVERRSLGPKHLTEAC